MKTATIARAAPTATPTSVIWMIERFRTGKRGSGPGETLTQPSPQGPPSVQPGGTRRGMDSIFLTSSGDPRVRRDRRRGGIESPPSAGSSIAGRRSCSRCLLVDWRRGLGARRSSADRSHPPTRRHLGAVVENAALHAAGDRDHLAGHVARELVGGEHDDLARDVLGLGHLAERHRPRDPVDQARLVQRRARHRRHGPTRADGVHAAERRDAHDLVLEAEEQAADDRGLGGGVVGVARPRRRAPPSSRRGRGCRCRCARPPAGTRARSGTWP